MTPNNRNFIEQILAGELAEDAPEYLAELRVHPELQTELEQMRALMARLDADATAEREAQTSPAPSPARQPAKGPAKRLQRLLLTAAAVVAALFTVSNLMEKAEVRDPSGYRQTLSAGTVEYTDIAPLGQDSSFAEFRATGKIPSHVGIQLRIWEDVESLPELPTWSHELLPAERTPDGFRWTPSSEQLAAFPESIHWEIWLIDMGGSAFGPIVVSASR